MSRVEVPPAPSPGGDVVFVPPPGWTPPPGFDPRRGHPVDPTWPPAPAGWVFWAPVPAPRGLGAALRRGWWGPAILLAVVALIVVAVVASPEPGTAGPSTGVGSCWKEGSGDRIFPADCSDSAARYVVTDVVLDPASCPETGEGYLDPFDGQTGYSCLALRP